MKLLPVTTKFAQAGVMDLAKATELLAGAQQSLGMRMKDPTENAREMARVSDVLTEANNRALGTIEDFAQAITNKAGAQLKIYNKTVEEGTAALMALAPQNVKGRLAGQQLDMVMRDLARWRVGLLLGAGGIAGAQVGAHLLQNVPAPVFHKIFGSILLGLAVWMFLRK